MKIPLVGQSYTSRSLAADAQATVNLYGELIDDIANTRSALDPSPPGKNRAVLYGTPGRHLFRALSGDVRGVWSGGGRLFVANNSNLVELNSSGSIVTNRSYAASDDGKPVQIFSNGNQLLIISGGFAFCDNGAGPVLCTFSPFNGAVSVPAGIPIVTWVSGDQFLTDGTWPGTSITIGGTVYTILSVQSPTQLTLTTIPGFQPAGTPYSHVGSPVTAVTGAYLDGYFIVQRPRSPGSIPDLGRQLNFSAILDGTRWNGLDFVTKQAYPDYIRGILTDSEQLYIFGDETLEIFQTNPNPGSTGDVFVRIPGAMARNGSVSPWGCVSLDGRVFFVGGDDRGQLAAYVLDGFTPKRISHHAAEAQWNAAGLGPNAISYAYQEEGHSFWVINFGAQTWVFDPLTSTWHERRSWDGASFQPYRTQYHTFIPEWGTSGKHITAGLDGNVCESSVNFYDDLGQNIKWLRALPYIYAGGKRQYFGQLTLEMETGTVASGAAPVVTYDYSDDRGNSFINPRTVSLGTHGQTAQRLIWNRNGSSRGRVMRFSGVGQSKVALIDCDCEVIAGSN